MTHSLKISVEVIFSGLIEVIGFVSVIQQIIIAILQLFCPFFCFIPLTLLFNRFVFVFKFNFCLFFQLYILKVHCHSILRQFSSSTLPFPNYSLEFHGRYWMLYWVYHFHLSICECIENNSLFSISQNKISFWYPTFLQH
jgi:hypothetical protein